MNSFKITFLNGDHFITSFNGNYSDAVQYYLGNLFNIGSVEDNMQKCIKVKQVFTCKFNGRTVGAIGCFYDIEIEICAESKEAAHIKLYDTHEHITDLVIEE